MYDWPIKPPVKVMPSGCANLPGVWMRTPQPSIFPTPLTTGSIVLWALIAAAPHRRAAFEACDFLMDYLKSRAPFWKKETGPGGARWIEPRPQDLSDIARWETP